jgi:hypothetical protein
MKAKNINCVEMKHRGAEDVYKKTKNLAKDQELEYWNKRGQVLKERKNKIAEKNSVSVTQG